MSRVYIPPMKKYIRILVQTNQVWHRYVKPPSSKYKITSACGLSFPDCGCLIISERGLVSNPNHSAIPVCAKCERLEEPDAA